MALITNAGSASADSYASVAEADYTLLEARLHKSSTWEALTYQQKEHALRWATRLLDVGWAWFGSPASTTQRLRMPRVGLVDQDGNVVPSTSIPEQIKEACAEFAAYLAERDRVNDPQLATLGFSRAKIGSLEVEVSASAIQELVPPYILLLTDHYGTLVPAARFKTSGVRHLKRS